MTAGHSDFHDAVEIELNGQSVLIDLGVADLIMWMNELPGVATFTCCQGGPESCRPDAFIGFECSEPESFQRIKEFVGVGRYSEFNGKHQLSLDVSELVELNRQRFPDSEFWRLAFE